MCATPLEQEWKIMKQKEKIVKVEDMGVDDAGSTRFHNMLLDLLQYNNIEIPTKT